MREVGKYVFRDQGVCEDAKKHGLSENEREIQRSIEANKTGRKCETCGNEIRKSDDRATERQCGFCATVHPANETL